MNNQHIETNIKLVREAQETFGGDAAREVWFKVANIYSEEEGDPVDLKATVLLELIKLAVINPKGPGLFTPTDAIMAVMDATGLPEENVSLQVYNTLFGLVRGHFLDTNTKTDDGLTCITQGTVYWPGDHLDDSLDPAEYFGPGDQDEDMEEDD
jgi:hypothetical protein